MTEKIKTLTDEEILKLKEEFRKMFNSPSVCDLLRESLKLNCDTCTRDNNKGVRNPDRCNVEDCESKEKYHFFTKWISNLEEGKGKINKSIGTITKEKNKITAAEARHFF